MYRRGYMPLPGIEGVQRKADWSDRFFNYVPAEQGYDDRDAMSEAAKQFIEANDDCPYTAEFLVADFYKRL